MGVSRQCWVCLGYLRYDDPGCWCKRCSGLSEMDRTRLYNAAYAEARRRETMGEGDILRELWPTTAYATTGAREPLCLPA
jgi:hypothetical protein